MAQGLTLEDVLRRVEQHVPFTPEEVLASREAIEAAGFRPDSCVLVKKKSKERVRQWGDDLVQMACNATIQDDRLRAEVRSMTQALSHLLNSQSYEDGVLHDYDKKTIDCKLGRTP